MDPGSNQGPMAGAFVLIFRSQFLLQGCDLNFFCIRDLSSTGSDLPCAMVVSGQVNGQSLT